MQNTLRLLVLLLLAGVAPAQCQTANPPDEWDVANLQVRRLSPDAFPKLPAKIKKDLKNRQCTIPQTFEGTAPHNVISGSFARKGQKDWAVLCSTGMVSSIIIYWDGSTAKPLIFSPAADRDYLQGTGDGIGYSREISAAGNKDILAHYRAHGGPKPPPLTHDGIECAFIEKASSILYYYKNEWLRLTGAD